MKSIFILLAIILISSIANAHENHNHQIYNWSNSKNKIIKSESTFNIEKLEDKKNNTKNNTISSWIKIFRRKINF